MHGWLSHRWFVVAFCALLILRSNIFLWLRSFVSGDRYPGGGSILDTAVSGKIALASYASPSLASALIRKVTIKATISNVQVNSTVLITIASMAVDAVKTSVTCTDTELQPSSRANCTIVPQNSAGKSIAVSRSTFVLIPGLSAFCVSFFSTNLLSTLSLAGNGFEGTLSPLLPDTGDNARPEETLAFSFDASPKQYYNGTAHSVSVVLASSAALTLPVLFTIKPGLTLRFAILLVFDLFK